MRAPWAMLALGNVALASYLPTRYPTTVDRLTASFFRRAPDALIERQTTQCGPSNPCVIGCCGNGGDPNNEFICGTGSTFCGAGNCTDTCDYKADCNPGGWESQYYSADKCPLNVCCSNFGFCGTTEEFCGDSIVPQPSCSPNGGSTKGRRVAYYEGWATGNPCGVMLPAQIPLGLWTHINIAFGSIDPSTYLVTPMDGVPNSISEQISMLKGADPGLKVFISIGGWSFNDPGATANTFSTLAGSSSAQQTFFASLISFMATYNLDGVDIDWEYPVAPERGGNADDFANFPTFMQNLRAAMNKSGYLFGLTATTPSSYWYLREFDIVSLSQTLDWFNVMTYDLHGTWDGTDPYIGQVALAHTNLTEIRQTFDLFWRNNINPDKITMGLGFYGRSFTMADPSCMSAGCPFSDGGKPGPCSQSSGTLTASEIRSIIAEGATVTLDPVAAVEIVTWDNDQWVSYDDLPTLKMKIEYANSICLGGIMVWAVDQDDLNATSTNQLASAMGLPATSKPIVITNATRTSEDAGIHF
ncbi:glycoside hydrolase superfamily [Trichoderma chlorosporum]